jgi:hypothetical protein
MVSVDHRDQRKQQEQKYGVTRKDGETGAREPKRGYRMVGKRRVLRTQVSRTRNRGCSEKLGAIGVWNVMRSGQKRVPLF